MPNPWDIGSARTAHRRRDSGHPRRRVRGSRGRSASRTRGHPRRAGRPRGQAGRRDVGAVQRGQRALLPAPAGGIAETVPLLAEAGAGRPVDRGLRSGDRGHGSRARPPRERVAEAETAAHGTAETLARPGARRTTSAGWPTSTTRSAASWPIATPGRTSSTRRGSATSTRSQDGERGRGAGQRARPARRADVAQLAASRVRRISTGSLLTSAAYGALVAGDA